LPSNSSARSDPPRRRSSPGAAAAGHTRLGPELADLNALTAAHGEAAVTASAGTSGRVRTVESQ
jgi:hypothetical protein